MALFQKQKPPITQAPITSENAQTIYWLLKDSYTETDIVLMWHSEEHIKTSCDEMCMKQMQIKQIMSDLENQPTTEADLVALLPDGLLDNTVLVADVIAYSNGKPQDEPPKTYEDFKATFTNIDII